MILLDVNVLVHACRRDAARHAEYRRWLEQTLTAGESVGIAPESLAATVRITTHRKIWKEPLSLEEAFAFTDAVRDAPAAVPVQPGPGHWDLFSMLARQANARGNLITDAWMAALAVEQGCTLVTTDRDFGRFKPLRWRLPLE